MLRRRENSLAWPAGILALLVHGLFFILMVVSFSWKHVSTQQEVAQVELWDSLPQPHATPPEPKPEPKPEPPPKPEPKPEPLPPEPKAEIQLKAKPPAPEVKKPPKVEPKKPDTALKAKEEEKKRKEEALRKLQQDLLKDDRPVDHDADKALADAKAAAKATADAKRAAEALAASSGVVNEYKARIVAKIKSNVNKQVCGSDKPVLIFAIAMMPTGEVSGTPRLVKSSGLSACDQAVEYAIMKSQPLPLPPQPELFAYFRDLTLTFRPNDDQ